MKPFRCLAFVATALTLLAVRTPVLGGDPFPAIEGKDLTKEPFAIPTSLGKPLNLIVVAFKQEQQSLVDTWIPSMVALEETRPDFAFYEFPTMPKMNPAIRWFIANGMRSGIKEEASRKRTVSFHIDKAPFREALAIPHEDDIYTFLVDLDGTILWRTTGIYDSDNVSGLKEVLAALSKPINEAEE